MLLDELSRPETWEIFYQYKTGLACPKNEIRSLRDYIDCRAWIPVCERIERGEPFPLPRRAVISKLYSEKKRIVYIYPEPENTLLKLLTWLLLRRYDGLFSPGLFSFRPGRTAQDAIRMVCAVSSVQSAYAYKADIRNYFNSIDPDRFLPELRQVLSDEPKLFSFLAALLREPRVLEKGRELIEPKGIMAGTPLSAFYANLYLRQLDQHFAALGIPYARYSDDVILFAPTEEEMRRHAARLRELLCARGLTLNPSKECYFTPQSGWTFLGFCCRDGRIDVAPATLDKLKAKMRRKTRALARWRDRTGHSGPQAAAAFIRVFNRKLLDAPVGGNLSWSSWFFSVITTTESLHTIDLYAQDCLRTLISGKRTKARFNVRYADLKALGYRSLVHAYYEHHESFRAGNMEKPGRTAP